MPITIFAIQYTNTHYVMCISVGESTAKNNPDEKVKMFIVDHKIGAYEFISIDFIDWEICAQILCIKLCDSNQRNPSRFD